MFSTSRQYVNATDDHKSGAISPGPKYGIGITFDPAVSVATALVAQGEPGVDVDVAIGEGVAVGAVGAFLTTLVVGAILLAVAAEYTERMTAAVLDEPLGSFITGIGLVTVLLAVTIFGLVLAIPLALVAYTVWAIEAAIAYLAIGDRLVGREDGWLKPLLVGAGINGLLALAGVGGIVSIAIGAAGFGAVLGSWFE